jgi:hypothetical protein
LKFVQIGNWFIIQICSNSKFVQNSKIVQMRNLFKIRKLFKCEICSKFKKVHTQNLFKICSKFEFRQTQNLFKIRILFKLEICSKSKFVQNFIFCSNPKDVQNSNFVQTQKKFNSNFVQNLNFFKLWKKTEIKTKNKKIYFYWAGPTGRSCGRSYPSSARKRSIGAPIVCMSKNPGARLLKQHVMPNSAH